MQQRNNPSNVVVTIRTPRRTHYCIPTLLLLVIPFYYYIIAATISIADVHATVRGGDLPVLSSSTSAAFQQLNIDPTAYSYYKRHNSNNNRRHNHHQHDDNVRSFALMPSSGRFTTNIMTRQCTLQQQHSNAFRLFAWQSQNRVQQRLFASTTTSTSDGTRSIGDDNEMDEGIVDGANDNTVVDVKQVELMYVLGVNLARQLGDIRPLLVSPTNINEDNPDDDNDTDQQQKVVDQYAMELSQVTAGIVDTMIGRITEQQQIRLLQQHGTQLNALIQERSLILQEKLVQAGIDMLQIMSESDGAITIQSPSSCPGVVVHILDTTTAAEGTDTSADNDDIRPTRTSIIKMHYHGTLADGTIFDSSWMNTEQKNGNDGDNSASSKEAINIPIVKLCPGLRDGIIQYMKVGDTAMIGIPPQFGYGAVTTPPNANIPNNSTLFYKVQLIDVLTAGIVNGKKIIAAPQLLNVDGTELSSSSDSATKSSILFGANGRPL